MRISGGKVKPRPARPVRRAATSMFGSAPKVLSKYTTSAAIPGTIGDPHTRLLSATNLPKTVVKSLAVVQTLAVHISKTDTCKRKQHTQAKRTPARANSTHKQTRHVHAQAAYISKTDTSTRKQHT